MEGDILSYFDQLAFWHWMVLGLVLLIIEVTFFGVFFILWVGLSAMVVGVLMLVMPDMGWQAQFVIWGVLSVVTMVGWYQYRKKNPTTSDEPLLNRRGEQYVGRTFTLDEPVVNGQGHVVVDDSRWKIEAEEDFEAGTKVKATAVDGTILKVEKAD